MSMKFTLSSEVNLIKWIIAQSLLLKYFSLIIDYFIIIYYR